jgi:cytochrome c
VKPLLVAVGVASVALGGAAQASEELAQKSGCLNCDAIEKKKMGPAFKDVAAKYKGKSDAEAALVTKIATASGHPKVNASEGDVKSLVKWVLAM